MPRRLKEISVALPKVKETLTAKLGRAPTVAEVAQHMDKKESDILMAMESSMAYGAYSLDETFSDSGDEGETSKYEKFTSTEEAGYRGLENREIIDTVLNELSDTNKYIFRERFIKEKSQSDIASHLGVSQMTVSRAERNIKERFAKELQR